MKRWGFVALLHLKKKKKNNNRIHLGKKKPFQTDICCIVGVSRAFYCNVTIVCTIFYKITHRHVICVKLISAIK